MSDGYHELAQRVRALEIANTRRPEIDFHGVYARASTAAGQSIVTGTTPTIIDFGTVNFDPWGAITTGANWRFTAPVAGCYTPAVFVLWTNTTNWALGEIGELQIRKNGNAYSIMARNDNYGATSLYKPMPGIPDGVELAVGEYMDIRILQTSGLSLALFNNVVYVRVFIHKV